MKYAYTGAKDKAEDLGDHARAEMTSARHEVKAEARQARSEVRSALS